MSQELKVGILGATGMVGQRFITLLANHPWFQVNVVAASENSAGKEYQEAVKGRWHPQKDIPEEIKNLKVKSVQSDIDNITNRVDLVFSAISADKDLIRQLEENYASQGIPVISNNSAHRWTEDIPMLIPEVNPKHTKVIKQQQEKRRWQNGFIVVKPNCSIQSYVPVLEAWQQFQPEKVIVSTYQAISGAGETLESYSEIKDNVIPHISNEEKKSEQEPLKIWADLTKDGFQLAEKPKISSNCLRVPVEDGHMAAVNIRFKKNPNKERLIEALDKFNNPLSGLNLPSAPHPLFQYFSDSYRPQTNRDRDWQNGMGISVGRVRSGNVLDWKFVALSHNTLRGAAGGSILNAELLTQQGYIR